MDLGKDIYSGAAAYGQFNAFIGLIFGFIIGVILISIGTYLIVTNKGHYQSVNGVILNDPSPPSCTAGSTTPNTPPSYSCDIWVQYVINNQTEKKRLMSTNNNSPLVAGNSVTLYYDPSNPNDTLTTNNPTDLKILAWGFIVFGIILMIGSVISFYVTRKYKFAAAAQGIAGAYNLIK